MIIFTKDGHNKKAGHYPIASERPYYLLDTLIWNFAITVATPSIDKYLCIYVATRDTHCAKHLHDCTCILKCICSYRCIYIRIYSQSDICVAWVPALYMQEHTCHLHLQLLQCLTEIYPQLLCRLTHKSITLYVEPTNCLVWTVSLYLI